MAVIGSRDNLNRDPNNLQSTIDDRAYFQLNVQASPRTSNSSYFWSSNFLTKTDSSFSQNTSKTIIDLTGGSGYLTNIVCPTVPSGYNTFTHLIKITIDGAETSLFFDSNNWHSDFTGENKRLVLGYLDNRVDQYIGSVDGYVNTTTFNDLVHYNGPVWDADHSWIAPYPQREYHFLPNPSGLKSTHPEACVRFETSLKVEITCNFPSTSATNRNAGVVYILDAPAS
tara:strand:+ start:355 stop:1035 length:681 start_codon:yes stop_codon:yes gene_type:complete